MGLKDQIKSDLKNSMKSGDNVSRGVLRLLNSDIKNAEIEKRKELSDNEIIEVVKRSIKRRKDSIEQYKKGGRKDLVDQEEKELKVLEKYMPEQMSEKETRVVIQDVIRKSGATSASDFGKVMGAAMKEFKGKADGNLVSKIVKEELGKIGN